MTRIHDMKQCKSVRMASVQLSDIEIARALDVLRSGNLREGDVCREFERRFAERCGARYAVATSSGTAALHLAYAALLSPGDEVIVPSFTFVATASMVEAVGAVPVLVDVHRSTWVLDAFAGWEDTHITPKTRAIAPVHLFGMPVPSYGMQRLAKERNLRLIWDCAQAFGALAEDGRSVGGADDVCCHSFYATKNLFIGEGGMVTTNDEATYERVKLLKSHGQERKYRHTALGFNYRMTDYAAAIGNAQLDRDHVLIQRRIEIASQYDEAFYQVSGLKPQWATPDGGKTLMRHARNQYCLLVNERSFGMNRDGLRECLARHGIETAVHYPMGLHQQPVFEDRYGKKRLPETENLCQNIIALPIHPFLLDDDVDWVIRVVQDAAKTG